MEGVEMTEMHHVVVAIAAMALVYYTMVRPMMSTGPSGRLGWMALALLVWAVGLPAAMVATQAYDDGVLHDDGFLALLELVVVCLGVLITQAFVAYFHVRGRVSNFGLTLTLNLLIIESLNTRVMNQVKHYLNPVRASDETLDLLNAGVGVIQMLLLIHQIFAGEGMKVVKSEDGFKIRLESNYKPWFILSYTFCNILFRALLFYDTSALMFIAVTLLLPLIEHFNGEGDWVQVRVASFLAFQVLSRGITPGQGRFFPAYNQAQEDDSLIVRVQQNDYFRWALFVSAAATLVLAIWEGYVQSETFLGVFTTTRRKVEKVNQLHMPEMPHLGSIGVHAGRQLRMHKRGSIPAWKARLNLLFTGFLIVSVAAFAVLTSVLENVVVPSYVPGETNETALGLSQVLTENCLGSSCWFFGVTLATFFFALAAYYVVNRVSPLFSFVFTFGTLVLLIPYTIAFETMDTSFEYIKLLSVYAGCFFISIFRLDNMLRQQKNEQVGYYEPGQRSSINSLARFVGDRFMPPNDLMDSSSWCWVLWWALAINILEATMKDAQLGYYFNAGVGLWLVLAMPRKQFSNLDRRICWFAKMRKSWSHILFIDQSRVALYDMVYETDWFWVLMYTSWNLCFCLDERREHFAAVCIVLIASLLTELPRSLKSDPHLWAQTRGFTLLLRYMLIAIYDPYQEFADSRYWFNRDAAMYWGMANLALCVVYSLYKLVTYGDGSAQRRVSMGSRASRESMTEDEETALQTSDRTSQRLSIDDLEAKHKLMKEQETAQEP